MCTYTPTVQAVIAQFKHYSENIIAPCISGVAILAHVCGSQKLPREFLAAMLLAGVAICLVNHARACRIQVTAWPMHHELGDSAVQLRVALRVRDLRADQAINVIHCDGLVLFSKDQKEVEVWQAPFLELNGAIVSNDPAQGAFVHQEVQSLLDLLDEDPGNDVRAVGCSLPRQQAAQDLRPIGIAADGDEQIWLAKVGNPGHGILQFQTVYEQQNSCLNL